MNPAMHHVVTHSESTPFWTVGVASTQGYRPNQEDAYALDLKLDARTGVVAVFDGHGGAECATHCSCNLMAALKSTPGWHHGDLKAALGQAFLELDKQLCADKPCCSGTTGTVALMQGSHLVVAGVGDSKAVLLRGGRIVPMSVDHKPTSPAEEERIRGAGGFVHRGRVNACLNISRALGDAQFKQDADRPATQQQVSPEPDIRESNATCEQDFLLVCSDGVWNSMRESVVLRFVRQRLRAGMAPAQVCEQLCDECMQPSRTAGDNITCVLAVPLAPTFAECISSASASALEASPQAVGTPFAAAAAVQGPAQGGAAQDGAAAAQRVPSGSISGGVGLVARVGSGGGLVVRTGSCGLGCAQHLGTVRSGGAALHL